MAMYASPLPSPQRSNPVPRQRHNRAVSEFVNEIPAKSSSFPFENRLPIFATILPLCDRIAAAINLLASDKIGIIGRDNNEAVINAEEGVGVSYNQMQSAHLHYPTKAGPKLD